MKITLAAIGLKNGDVEFNKNQIIQTIKMFKDKTDLLLFGESFLHGFDSLSWNYELDKKIAVKIDSKEIEEIRSVAKDNSVAVSFGYYQLENDSIYSSQIVIDNSGKVINNYQRVSKSWKIESADYHYKEGKCFSSFELNGKKLSIGLCGDLWYQENIERMKQIDHDIVLWPVYTDFGTDKWNLEEKFEYAKQVEVLNRPTLYVNSYRLDNGEEECAKGGAALFVDGKVKVEIPSGIENCLIVDI